MNLNRIHDDIIGMALDYCAVVRARYSLGFFMETLMKMFKITYHTPCKV